MAKRGRPSGSTSFVRVDMATLNNLFKRQQHIPVSRVWLREQGYELIEDSKPVPVTTTPDTDNVGAETDNLIEMSLQS